MIYNIIFYCNWGDTPEILLNKYKLMTKNNTGKWNNVIGVSNISKADVVIFIEGIPSNFDLNSLYNKKIICFPREPLIKKNWEYYKIKNNYTYNEIYHVVTNPQFIDKNYNFLYNLNYTSSSKNFSAIISNKSNGKGYKLRRSILIEMANKYPNLCDIYGDNWGNELGISYKGKLGCYHKKNDNYKLTKYDGLIDYKYSLCIENCSIKNYFTEKFTDSILCWTIPIYYGCINIDKYFPKNCFYYVDITKENCLDVIKDIINKPITDDNINALSEARNLILNKYNIWPTIENIIS